MAGPVRRNAVTLAPLQPGDAWDPIFEWYARGIRTLQGRLLHDPTSWRYQAAIHAYDRQSDPLQGPGDQLPSAADQKRFWNQCQHMSWFFLPWHRLYLTYFEQMVRAAIVAQGGPDGWALPYWNYGDRNNPRARQLPLAFTLPTLPDGTANPLRIEDRNRGNTNRPVATANEADARAALLDPRFVAASVGGTAGFGGPQTAFSHGDLGTAMGKLEGTPHGTMHVAVGGFMGSFATAGLDPLFWLHHANVDRLWEVWRRRDAAHRDPAQAQWRTGVRFALHDARGQVIEHTALDAVETTAVPMGYSYEDVSDPVAPAAAPPGAGQRRAAMGDHPPELVGATDAPVVLTGEPTTARVPIETATGPAARRSAGEPREVHLNVEQVTGLEASVNYAVYLNVPDGASPEEHPELFAGLVSTFGVPEATRGAAGRPANGVTVSLDVTEVVQRLETQGSWTGAVHVTFVPESLPPEQGRLAAPAASSPITVGRVSVYVS